MANLSKQGGQHYIHIENGAIVPNGLVTTQQSISIGETVRSLKHLVSATLRGHRVIITKRDAPDVSLRLFNSK